ncbi:hypothetical protein LTR22_003129 [Elasticomyces elasticus]|nr:hypothetical protein LTR22_003129 [Elasticomyces elasticus]KAK4929610.1 hypothetical protein LTR49_003908 [Elasticomyces elasticus]KAK5767433.1 hypothetical protein LTS12_002271 [Elasticomyces elasticus]
MANLGTKLEFPRDALDEGGVSPVLRDRDGVPLVATVVPPAIDFEDFSAQPAVGEEDGKDRDSYFQRHRGSDATAVDAMASESESSSESDHEVQNSKQKKQNGKSSNKGTADEKKKPKQANRSQSYTRYSLSNEHFKSKGRFSKRDGRLRISINETVNSGYMAKAIGQSLRHHLDIPHRRHEHRRLGRDEVPPELDAKSSARIPRLNIVIMVIGSRGDIQPFIRIGKILKEQHGHRVRIASHPVFREFVEKENELEFFSVGGDPAELMAFMVKNPGLVPNLSTIREGEIQRRRTAMATMFDGFWRACINTSDDEKDLNNLKMMDEKSPFIADAIIANPPSMAHVHIAEKLGVPLHMMFTFPYTPTQSFPHPLATIVKQKSNVDANYVNFMSYGLVEMMTWQGLGDIVNRFRERTLGLEPVASLWSPGALFRMQVPYTYLWSPSLVPKPKDWGPEIDIAGFVFLDLAGKYKPDEELEEFLNAGVPPVYIGFGSIVVDDPNALTQMIFEATKKAGVRALVNKGWGGFGSSNDETPDHIFMLGNTPHDWLFPRVKAVVHHGGAGTTAIGLKCAKPTMIVPFFGDQPFWGAMVAAAKAGAHECIPYKNMTVDKFADGIKQCLTEEAQQNIQKIADSIVAEGDGAENAVNYFHESLPLAGKNSMRCSLLEDRVAAWHVRHSSLRLSPLAAQLLHEQGKLKWSDVKLLRHYQWNDFDGPGEPITGTVSAVKHGMYGIGEGMGMVPVRIAKHVKQREAHDRKKQELQRRKSERRRRKAAPQEHEEVSSGATTTERPEANRGMTQSTLNSTISLDPTEPLAQEVAGDVGLGMKQAGGALLTLPNDLHVAIAQGLHNAPRLWGDATVRKPVRITGFKSGCLAARKEFVYDIRDGWSGLILHPKGEWDDGDTMSGKLVGLGIGVGKGIGGFVLKNVNAIVAPPAYFGRGLVRYVEKRSKGPGSKLFIRRAQILRGKRDLASLADEDADEKSDDGKSDVTSDVRLRVSEGWSAFESTWKQQDQDAERSGKRA